MKVARFTSPEVERLAAKHKARFLEDLHNGFPELAIVRWRNYSTRKVNGMVHSTKLGSDVWTDFLKYTSAFCTGGENVKVASVVAGFGRFVGIQYGESWRTNGFLSGTVNTYVRVDQLERVAPRGGPAPTCVFLACDNVRRKLMWHDLGACPLDRCRRLCFSELMLERELTFEALGVDVSFVNGIPEEEWTDN
eukprot:2328637-Rhodomonas_salina.1